MCAFFLFRRVVVLRVQLTGKERLATRRVQQLFPRVYIGRRMRGVFKSLAEVTLIIRRFVRLCKHLFTVVETRAHASPLRVVSDIHG